MEVNPASERPSYRSENGELYWDVHVRSDEFGFDTHVRKRVLVGVAERS